MNPEPFAPLSPERPDATRLAAAQRVTWVSIIVNALLSTLQVVIGLFAHAQSLVADGLHSLADLIADIFVLIASRYSHNPADENHPYGHERIETVASLVLGVLLAATGAAILWSAIGRLQNLADAPPLHGIALWVAVLTLLGKEGLFRYMLKVGTDLRSPMLVANAWHARADAASSLVVAAGIGGSLMGWRLLDPIAAIVVGLMILRMSWQFMLEALRELVDTAIPDAERSALLTTINDTPGVIACHAIRTRRMAHKVLVDAHVQVAPRISVSEGHQIAETVHARVLAEHIDVLDVLVHVDVEADGIPPDTEQPSRATILDHVRTALGLPELESAQLTLHYLHSGLEAVVTLKAEQTPLHQPESHDGLRIVLQQTWLKR